MSSESPIFTVGHSAHRIGAFLGLLHTREVTELVDVRSAPYSRFHPQFNRKALARSLGEAGISYRFLGSELGGRPDPEFYDGGRVSYDRLRESARFKKGLDAVAGASGSRIALLCAEKEPLECHRGLLVAPALEARGLEVAHLLADGTVEPHGDAMDRLLDIWRMNQANLLLPRGQRIAQVLALQAGRHAHVRAGAASSFAAARTVPGERRR